MTPWGGVHVIALSAFPAYSPVESRADAGGRYFTGFKAKELSGGEIRKLHAGILFPDQPPRLTGGRT